MITYENECVGCPPELGCLYDSCPKRNVKHLYCDECGCEEEILYNYDGEELCAECLLSEFETIE